jgi:RNA-binding motif X-linked protein 2
MNNVRNIENITNEELKAGIIAGITKGSWHDEYRNSSWVFVGGLSFELTEGDIICVMSQWGEVEDIHYIRDKDTQKPKGFAFIKYEDYKSTVLAVDNFNGTKLLGRTLRVDHVSQYKLPKEIRDQEMEKLEKAMEKKRVESRGKPVSTDDLKIDIGPGHAYRNKELANYFNISKGVDLWNSAPVEDHISDDEKDKKKKKKKDHHKKKHKKEKKERHEKGSSRHQNPESDDSLSHSGSDNEDKPDNRKKDTSERDVDRKDGKGIRERSRERYEYQHRNSSKADDTSRSRHNDRGRPSQRSRSRSKDLEERSDKREVARDGRSRDRSGGRYGNKRHASSSRDRKSDKSRDKRDRSPSSDRDSRYHRDRKSRDDRDQHDNDYDRRNHREEKRRKYDDHIPGTTSSSSNATAASTIHRQSAELTKLALPEGTVASWRGIRDPEIHKTAQSVEMKRRAELEKLAIEANIAAKVSTSAAKSGSSSRDEISGIGGLNRTR